MDIKHLPTHDARLLTFKMEPVNGAWRIEINLSLHPDEIKAFSETTGDTSQNWCVRFEECWYFNAQVLMFLGSAELLDDFRIIPNSPMTQRLGDFHCAPPPELRHYQLTFTGGSALDILATSCQLSPLA